MEMQSNTLLAVDNLQVVFNTAAGSVHAVDGVCLHIKQGETLALLGESGCGKSMTALAIMQLLPITAAIKSASHISLNGQNLLSLSEVALRNIRGRRMAMIFQEPMTSLNPVLTIGEQIREVLHGHFDYNLSQQRSRTLELLDAVGIADVKRRVHEYPHQLSGGMKQRVMIALALAGEPELLIADEPTTALDVTIQAQVLALLKDLQRQTRMAMLLITHDLGVVRQVADRLAVMYAGHIIEEASSEDFFKQPKHPYSQKLLQALPSMEKRGQALATISGSVPALSSHFSRCRFLERCPYAYDACHKALPAWIELSAQHRVRCHLADNHNNVTQFPAPHQATQLSDNKNTQQDFPLLNVLDLVIHFPIYKGLLKKQVASVKAVDGISLSVDKGQTLALVGESGCGKTTVGKGILQLIKLTTGKVNFAGKDIATFSHSQLKKIRSEIQVIFQDPYSAMNPRMMVADIISEGVGAMEPAQMLELVRQVGLPDDCLYRYPHEFSGGQRQRICIARALAMAPKLIICDEPTSALDVSVQAQIINLLKQLQTDLGLSYLFITHNISVVAYLADTVAVMYLGRIVEQGRVNDILKTPKHPYTKALLAAVPKVEQKHQPQSLQVAGELPSPIDPPQGCHFHPRCPHVTDTCLVTYPDKVQLSSEHFVKCHLFKKDSE